MSRTHLPLSYINLGKVRNVVLVKEVRVLTKVLRHERVKEGSVRRIEGDERAESK